jgi:hypothetical protein
MTKNDSKTMTSIVLKFLKNAGKTKVMYNSFRDSNYNNQIGINDEDNPSIGKKIPSYADILITLFSPYFPNETTLVAEN